MTMNLSGDCVLEGITSIEAAIKYNSRKIHLCYIDEAKIKKRDRRVLGFFKLLKQQSINIELCPRAVIDAFLENNDENSGSTHGGVVAICGERSYAPLDKLLQKVALSEGFAVVLDGIEDPFNFGYSVRNLYAAGASGIIIPKRNWLSSAGVCARASAGATEMCDVALMPEMECGKQRIDFLSHIKSYGISTVCAAKTAECTELFRFEPSFPMVLFIGGEKRGISPDFVSGCDSIVSIPYYSDARFSLPTASTAAIFGFELARIKNSRHEN